MTVLIPLVLTLINLQRVFNSFASQILLRICIPWEAFLGIQMWKPLLYSLVTHSVLLGQAALASAGRLLETRNHWLHCTHICKEDSKAILCTLVLKKPLQNTVILFSIPMTPNSDLFYLIKNSI